MILIYVLFAVLAVFFLFRSRSVSKRNYPPGPKGLPLIGCARDINEHNIIDKLFEYAEEYGDIFGMKLLHQNIICLNSSDVIRKALASEPYMKFMNDRLKFFFAETMLYGSQSVVFYGDAHSSVYVGMRKGIIKGLHVYGQEGMDAFEMKIHQELERLNKKIESFDGHDFDIVALLQRSLTNVISLVLTGETLADDDKDLNMYWDFVENANYFLKPTVDNILTMFPFLRHAPGYRSKFKQMSDARERLFQRYFKNRKSKTEGERNGILDYLEDLQRKSIEDGEEVIFTDDRIKTSVLDVIAAGILTTWSVLSSTFLCLVNNPEYQDKVFKEIDATIGGDRLPTNSDKGNCPYLKALELEVHRYLTVVPILGGRICNSDIKFEGFDLAKGTMVMINSWYVHHDPEIWGDPWKFRPERFLDANGQILPRDHIFRRNWIPFSVGRRQCLGEKFARSRYFLYMATLLGRWKFVGSPGKYGPCDARNMENIDRNATVRPKPFFCTAVRRQ